MIPPESRELSPDFLLVSRSLRDLHCLIAIGQDETPEGDALRDAMDGPGSRLTELEQARIRHLSEDLYSFTEQSTFVEMGVEEKKCFEQEIIYLFSQGKYDLLLQRLTQEKSKVHPGILSASRGIIWRGLEDHETAALFYLHGWKCLPDNLTILKSFLDELVAIGPEKSATILKPLRTDPKAWPPVNETTS